MAISGNAPADSPRFWQRSISLIAGPAYLALLAVLFSSVTEASIAVTAGVVFGCGLVVVAAIGALCVRLARRTGTERQFSMATALLLFVPFAVYLGAIRCVVSAIQQSGEDVEPFLWVLFGAYCLMFMVITTVVLLLFAEASVWLAISLFRLLHRRPLHLPPNQDE